MTKKKSIEVISDIRRINDRVWLVKKKYKVTFIDGEFYCTCPYFIHKGKQCKHIRAVIENEIIKDLGLDY